MASSVWSSLEVQAWQESAEKNQHQIRELFGNREYDFFAETDKSQLRKKISCAMFGPPTREKMKLTEDEENILTKVLNLVCERNTGQKAFLISFVYIGCLTRNASFYSLVIRLHLTDEKNEKIVKSVLIDDKRRSYVDFDDYLATNQLPKCIMCYPATGSYFLQSEDQKLAVKFRKSPACDMKRKVLLGTDIASTATGAAAAVACTACAVFAPIAVPAVLVGIGIAGGTTALYTVGRSIEKLVDRGVHGQTLSFRSPEARNCWFAIGSAVVVVGSAGAFVAMQRAAQVGVEIGMVAMQAPLVASLSVSGLGVVNSVANIVQKLLEGQPIEITDLLYFTSACLMFANVMMTTFKANAFLQEMSNSGKKSGNFFRALTDWIKERPEFSELSHPNQVVNLVPLGMFFNLPTATEALSTCFKATCKVISASGEDFARKLLTAAKYAKMIATHLYDFWSAFGNEMQIMVDWFCKVKGKKALCEIFGDITLKDVRAFFSHLVSMVSWIRNQGADKEALNHLAGVIQLQEETGSVKPTDGADKWIEEFTRICQLLKNELKRQKTIYQEGFKTAKKFSPNKTESEYQNVEEISEPLTECFWKKALTQLKEDFSSEASQLKLTKGLLKATPGSSSLEDVRTETTVHFFHGLTPGASDQQLSLEQYLAVAREKVGPVLDIMACSLEIDPESRMGFFRGVPTNAEGITCVIVNCEPEEGYVAGHVYVVKSKAG